MKYYVPIVLLFLLVAASCKSTEFTGFDYDPEGGEITTDREISSQKVRTIGSSIDGVWISNEFTGARVNDISRLGKNHYQLTVEPENSPINNSSWYSFKLWSDEAKTVTLEFNYPESRHRYLPKISVDEGENWLPISETDHEFIPASDSTKATIKVNASPDTIWVSAQQLQTTEQYSTWEKKMMQKPFVQKSVAGTTHQGRPISLLKITERSPKSQKGVIIIYSRQHPPEVPGYIAGLTFLEKLSENTDLANEFRQYFDVWAFPLMNPDGADNGHWRHNAGGVDLNRDWEQFNQPETTAVRNSLLPLLNRPNRTVFYGIDFHSTGSNIFYPIDRDVNTLPLHFTYDWHDELTTALPDVSVRLEPFDTTSPIAKNWTYLTFEADAVTFEVSDHMNGKELNEFAKTAADIFMQNMIEAYRQEFSPAVSTK
ncbi:MAG: M14 family metallopeptidase [Balneolaceae bacterium]